MHLAAGAAVASGGPGLCLGRRQQRRPSRRRRQIAGQQLAPARFSGLTLCCCHCLKHTSSVPRASTSIYFRFCVHEFIARLVVHAVGTVAANCSIPSS